MSGEKRMVAVCDAPAAMVPVAKLDETTEALFETVIPLIVNVEFPVFVIVNVALAFCPTATFPNATFPLSPITRLRYACWLHATITQHMAPIMSTEVEPKLRSCAGACSE